MVHAIESSSPARDAGACQANIITDQRGVPRLTPCDVGAYEYGQIYTLTVEKDGTGVGTVDPSVGVHNYLSGTVMPITASASLHSTFDGWSGAGCSGTANCAVTMDATRDHCRLWHSLRHIFVPCDAKPVASLRWFAGDKQNFREAAGYRQSLDTTEKEKIVIETKVIRIEVKFTRSALAILLGSLLLVGLMIAGNVLAQGPGPRSNFPPVPSGVEVVDTEEAVALETLATAENVASMISYQGQLTDPNGNPLNGVYDMTFQFRDAETGGAAVGSAISKTDVAVENGLFNVELNVNSSNFDGRALWLEITVGSETLAPTQRIMPAPYALSLRPGAIINDANSYVKFNKFDLNGMITNKIAVYGKTNSGAAFQYGMWGEGGTAGVYGFSENGYGVYASGGISGKALFANGDVKQISVGNGIVKAAVSALCTDSLPVINRYFNNLGPSPTAITVVEGGLLGECYLDFGYDISERFWSVTPEETILTSNCRINDSNHNQLRCRSYTITTGTNVPSDIIVLIY